MLYLTEHATSPLFDFPVLDGLYYDTVARRLLAGRGVSEIDPGFRPLLYPWLLSRLYALDAQWGTVLAVVLQHVLGVGTAILTTLASWRLGASAAGAAAAGLLFALAGPPLFFEGELLNTALIAFLVALLLLVLVELDPAEPKWMSWSGAGVAVGVAAQARPNALLLALALPLVSVLRRAPAGNWWRRFVPSLAALACLLVTLALFALWQKPHFGTLQLVTSSGGVNLYLGNKRGADGMIPRQDREVTYGATYLDSVEVFAREEAEAARPSDSAPLSPGQISRYWTARALREIAADPLAWCGLVARKVWLLLWTAEIPNNKTYSFVASEESRLLALLPTRWWMLVALAPLGVMALRGRSSSPLGLLWLLAVLFLWSAGIVLFFVNSRYRAPLWSPLCILAGPGAVLLWTSVAGRRWRPIAVPLALGAILATLSLVDWLQVPPFPHDRDYFYRSLARLERSDLEGAADDARRAAEIQPQEAVYHYQIGAVALAAHRATEAETALRAAGALKPGEPRIWNAVGLALEEQGQPAAAYAEYRRALATAPDFLPALANAALLELRAGLLESAAHRLATVSAAQEESVSVLCARAFLARQHHQDDEAERLLQLARKRDPELVERLERDQQARLTPAQLGVEAEGAERVEP